MKNESSLDNITLILVMLLLAGKCANHVPIFCHPKISDTPNIQTYTCSNETRIGSYISYLKMESFFFELL